MPRLRPATSYQHPRAPIRLIARKGRLPLRNAIAEALALLGNDFDKVKALHLLQNGMVYAVARETVDWKHFREVLKAVFDRWARIADAGAALGTRKISGAFAQRQRGVRFGKAYGDEEGLRDAYAIIDGNAIIAKDIGNRFNFDRFDEATIIALRAMQDDLISELSVQVRDTIQAIIMRGQAMGLSPAALVDQIESIISLTATQATAVMNYEAMLRTLNPNVLGRALRDDALDGLIQEAIDTGIPLGEVNIQEAVSAYEANYITYRAEMIAQTESVRAANWGLHEAYRQAVDRGALPDEAVRRYWQTALDEGVCFLCQGIPDLNPEGAGIDETFFSDDGPQDDPPVHPNCRCSIEYITDLDKVTDDDEVNDTEEIAA